MSRRLVDWALGRLPIIAAGCVLSLAAATETIAADDLAKCRALQDQVERLACYDEIANREPDAEPAKPAAVEIETPAEIETTAEVETTAEPAGGKAEVAAAAEAAATLPAGDEQLDTLGDEQLGERAKSERLEVQTRVVSCKKDDFRRYFFYFENGQVWKQKSDRRLSYNECDFNITITKDFFGYKMLPEGETRRIRISRVR